MVFRGKPSLSCERCRRKRLRCDRKLKGCGACKRAKVECPGYRSELDMKFCDQTTKAVTATVPLDPDVDKWRESPENLSGSGLMEEMALAYCYEHHIGNKNPHVRNETLLASMKALGMISLAFNTHSKHFRIVAQSYYARAINSVNIALASPEAATWDSTLLAVLILAHFEAIAGNGHHGNDAWSKHVSGIMVLLRLRGDDQLLTSGGRALFIQASTFVITQCLRNSTPTPSAFKSLLRQISEYIVDQNEPSWRITVLMAELADLKGRVVIGQLLDIGEIVDGMRAIDAKLAAIFNHISPLWAYETLLSPRPAISHLPPFVQIFQSSLAAQHWNMMRSGRLICHAYIIGALRQCHNMPSYVVKAQQRESATVIRQLQQDILSTVPQHLEFPWVAPYTTDLIPLPERAPVSPTLDVLIATKASSEVPILRTPRSSLMRSHLILAGRVAEGGEVVRKSVEEMLLVNNGDHGLANIRAMAPAVVYRLQNFRSSYLNGS